MKNYYNVVETLKRSDDEIHYYGGFDLKNANQSFKDALVYKEKATKAIELRVYKLDETRYDLYDPMELSNAIMDCIGYDIIKEEK